MVSVVSVMVRSDDDIMVSSWCHHGVIMVSVTLIGSISGFSADISRIVFCF